MGNVNFIDEFNSFMRYARMNQLTGRERLLWIALFTIANDRSIYNMQTREYTWPTGFFPVPNGELTLYSTLDKRGIESVRNSLKQKGLIDFRGGCRNTRPPEYKINYLSRNVGYKIVPNDIPNSEPNHAPNSEPNHAPNSEPNNTPNHVPSSAPLYININKIKEEEKETICRSSCIGGAADEKAREMDGILDAQGDTIPLSELPASAAAEIRQVTDRLFGTYGSRSAIEVDYVYAGRWIGRALADAAEKPGPETLRKKSERISELTFAFERAFRAGKGCRWDYIDGCLYNMRMNAMEQPGWEEDDEE